MKASMWRTKNRIARIEGNIGNWQKEEWMIASAIESYFADIFTTCCPSTPDMAKVQYSSGSNLMIQQSVRLMFPLQRQRFSKSLRKWEPLKLQALVDFIQFFTNVIGKWWANVLRSFV
ncbi:hypothetical protein PanWU01x14_285240 [Parasponia andersonii]|uniref:Uncharacterized protein n=1 Tax=Parasponia andersonii TaxID=3476 RepID=A0A2P5AZM1_PARAD|nr:hypothetical protein PanWU01x14_285240 [Parasponia andersonii]